MCYVPKPRPPFQVPHHLEAFCKLRISRVHGQRWNSYALRCTMPGPDSSYSCLEHHKFWKVLSEARIDPPIHTEYFRSGGATILTCVFCYDRTLVAIIEDTRTFMLAGDSEVSSFCIRSEIPGNIVVPPERTTLPYRSRRISRSHLKMELYLDGRMRT